MYVAKSMRDLLKQTQLSMEFFEGLDEFQIHFIEMCFQQAIDDQMGMMGEVENYNYNLFHHYKSKMLEEKYGIDPSYFKKSA